MVHLMRKMGFKEFLFIVPVLILIAVFSIWPVVQSFSYTFFDYQLNNQQKAGLYFSEHFNIDLFKENQVYLKMYLEEDMDYIDDPTLQSKSQKLITDVDTLAEDFEGEKGVISLSADEKDKLDSFLVNATNVVNEISNKYDTPNKDNLPLIVVDMKKSIIPSNFIGLKGYIKALTDFRLWFSLWNTFIFTVLSVLFEFVLGLALAMIMNKAIAGQGFIRTTSLIPWAIPTAVAALMWSYLYDGSSGVIAMVFEKIGIINDSRELLLTSGGAMASTILADVWKTTPYMALLLLAGLQNISKSTYEAAEIDGANPFQTFFRVTLPLLKPSILVALLFRTLDAFRVFDLIYVLTGGGPGGATETLSIYGYKTMFAQTNFGYGSVIVMIMFVSVAIIATIYVKFLGANLMEKS